MNNNKAASDFQSIFRVQDPFVFTIFGASGDLAKLKIFPAIFSLAEQKRFPSDYAIVGYARSKKTQEEFRQSFETSVRDHHAEDWGDYQEKILQDLLAKVHYYSGQYDVYEDFKGFKSFLAEKIDDLAKVPHLAYFSVPPMVVQPIVKQLAAAFDPTSHDLRLILEKPFGDDETSAHRVFNFITERFTEDQIYLLDHYLGKKAVRSLIPLRHMNRILNSMLRGHEIANIQISALEPMGVGERIGYFDEVGAIKDMMQSHLLQILSMLCMSIPIDRDAERVQEEKNAILSALEFAPDKTNISIGQYQDYPVKNSATPTFAALKLQINREEWYQVPIFLRTGKKLHEKHTFMVVELKKFPFQGPEVEPNRIIIEFYPDEKIQIRLLDEDGATLRQGEIAASESIACHGDYCLPEHGLLFLDVIRHEKTYFLSLAEVISSWHIIDQVLDFIATNKLKPEIYSAGTTGPKSQHDLMSGTDFEWYDNHDDK